MARRLLPEGPAATPRAGVRRLAAELHRDQRLVLLAAATLELARSGAAQAPDDFVFAVKGGAVHHPHEAAGRRRGAAGQLLRLRGAGPRAALGPAPVAAAAHGRRSTPPAWPPSSTRCPRTRRRRPRWPATTTSRPGSRTARTDGTADGPLRHVLEVRPRLPDAGVLRLLREHDIGMVVADSAGTWPMFDEVTAAWSTCACTATRSSTPAATADARAGRTGRRRSAAGPPRGRRLRLLRQRHQGARALRRDRAGGAAGGLRGQGPRRPGRLSRRPRRPRRPAARGRGSRPRRCRPCRRWWRCPRARPRGPRAARPHPRARPHRGTPRRDCRRRWRRDPPVAAGAACALALFSGPVSMPATLRAGHGRQAHPSGW